MSKSLRVLILGVVVAAMIYGAALTLALTRNLGSGMAIIVVIVGAVLLPAALLIVRGRLWNPLTALERGIQRVAEGDLSVQVPVARDDEVGRGTTHFNQMHRGREHERCGAQRARPRVLPLHDRRNLYRRASRSRAADRGWGCQSPGTGHRQSAQQRARRAAQRETAAAPHRRKLHR